MPIHEYQCPKCKVDFEEIVFDDTAPPCPTCGEKSTNRLISCSCIHSSSATSTSASMSSYSGGCAGCTGGNCSTCR